MKQIISTLLSLVLILTFSGCNDDENEGSIDPNAAASFQIDGKTVNVPDELYQVVLNKEEILGVEHTSLTITLSTLHAQNEAYHTLVINLLTQGSISEKKYTVTEEIGNEYCTFSYIDVRDENNIGVYASQASSGSLTIINYDSDNNIIEGTFSVDVNFFNKQGDTSFADEVKITNGTFKLTLK